MNNIYKNLATFELLQISRRLKFYTKENIEDININFLNSDDNVFNIINFLVSESNNHNEDDRNKILSSCAILNEYIDKTRYNINELLVLILSNIGFVPSSYMLNDIYDNDKKKYKGFNSYIDTIRILKGINENVIEIGSNEYILTSFQKKIWDIMQYERFLGVSSPTSSGKTFIIILKIIETILKNKNSIIVYVVPTLSLMSQITDNIKIKLKEFKLYEDVSVLNNVIENICDNSIFILTQERAISLLDNLRKENKKIDILIIDEIQNIEKNAINGGDRANILFDLILDIKQDIVFDKVILSGPLIDNISEVFVSVLDEKKHEIEKSKSSSVFNVVYSINKTGKDIFLNQYSVLTSNHISLKINNNLETIEKNIDKKKLKTVSYAEYLKIFLNAFNNKINMIFAPTSNSEPTIADMIKDQFEEIHDEKLDGLIKYIADTVHEQYFVCKYLRYGIMCNHGKMPYHVRSVLEYYFSEKNNKINTLISTTTLIQGVNLPIQNIILRNNILGEKITNDKLTEYEIMNLKGRAGRLMKDFIGRTFILDQTVLEQNNINLENNLDKKMEFGYAGIYKNNEIAVNKILLDNEDVDINNECKQLITYIRNTILLFKNNKEFGKKRLELTLGKDASMLEKYEDIYKTIKDIDINEEILKNNRQWDPKDLNKIRLDEDVILKILPMNHSQIKGKMFDFLCYIKDNFSDYFKKYLENTDEGYVRKVSNDCHNWVNEKPLRSIIKDKINYNNDNKTDSHIDKIIFEMQTVIAFKLSSLLKPFYSIVNNDNELKIINSIEIGAFLPITKILINIGIHRETAIFLKERYFNNVKEDDLNILYIKNKLSEILLDNNLNYWYKIQIQKVL